MSRRCFECKAAIPEQRLTALPTVRNCEECAARWRVSQSEVALLAKAWGGRATVRRFH